MIDREGKKIINGFGTIVVGHNGGNTFKVGYIRPPREIGSSFASSEVTYLDEINFSLTFGDWDELLEKLSKVTPDNTKFQFKDWEINFDNYNEESVKTWKRRVKDMTFFTLTLAC